MSYNLKNVKYSPLKGQNSLNVSSKYGFRTFYNGVTKRQETGFHNGIDLTNGTHVVAPEDGEVVEVYDKVDGYSEKYSRGNYVILKHREGLYTVYYHLKKGSVLVEKGEKVKRGDELAEVGSTGHATGVHLHYGVKVNSSWVDPSEYLLGRKRLVSDGVADEYVVYKVKQGDTLSEIASKYSVNYKEVAELNGIENSNLIYTGEQIKIPVESKKHVVVKGETLSEIAAKYGLDWKRLYEKNRDIIGNNPDLIRAGMVLRL